MDRRGFISDAAIFIVLLFVVAIGLLLTYFAFSQFNDLVQGNNLFTSHSQEVMEEQTGRMDNVLDYLFVTLFFGVVIALMVTSYVLQTNPGMFFLLLLVVVLLGAVAGYLGNAYEDVTESSAELSATGDNFPITGYIMSNYMIACVIVVFLMLIVFFAKPNGGGYE